ncbi:hypothetical protein [Geothrix terrae]|uniref:hypothetical protein n=1 Tax=Geothrix terrae TaxID=2922720 RepID=UPI001FAE17FB|nr:hypothetical protein [Geothrix terrae]
MSPILLVAGGLVLLFVIYVAYRIGKALLRVFVGLAALALLSWGLWKLFHS